MRLAWAGPAALGVLAAACSDPVADARKRLEMVRADGSVREVCRQAREVQAAALKAGNEAAYRDARVDRIVECAKVDSANDPDLAERDQDVQADNMDFMAPEPAAAR